MVWYRIVQHSTAAQHTKDGGGRVRLRKDDGLLRVDAAGQVGRRRGERRGAEELDASRGRSVVRLSLRHFDASVVLVQGIFGIRLRDPDN